VVDEPIETPGVESVGDAPGVGERRRGGELVPALCFSAGIVAGLALMVLYALGGQTQLEGILLFIALGGIGAGLVSWSKRFMTTAPETEPRPRLASTEDEIKSFSADFDQGEYQLERRAFLTKLLVGALGALGLAALFPIASLGPPARKSFRVSPYRRGMRLVTENGKPVRADSVNVNGVITVFPDGDRNDEFAQVVLIGLDPQEVFVPRPGREDWTPRHLVAYSKVCTHAGCPVGLYQQNFGELLCPCHQSTFNVYDGARPVFGPAATSLPQLPLDIDDEGYVIAAGDLSGPPGPAYWNQQYLWKEDNP
jgi:ubiquinol-cytochrome c reductase iron-sulfur subunit